MASQKSFSLKVASEPSRRNAYTRPGLLTSSPLVDRIQGYVSIITGTLIMTIGILGMLMLVPGFLLAKVLKGRSKDWECNKSLTGDGSDTAVLTLMERSQMNLMNAGGPDHLAPLLMKDKSILGIVFGPVWGGALWSDIYLLMQRINFYLVRRILQEQTAHWEPHKVIGGGKCLFIYLSI